MIQIYLESFFENGYRRLMKYIENIGHLDDKIKKIIYHRIEVIEFFDQFGLEATIKAFKVRRSTIFSWKRKLKLADGKLTSLIPGSKTPNHRTKRKILFWHTDFIEQYRHQHPGVSKTTIKPALDVYCQSIGIETISESAVGRVIKELKEKGKIPNIRLTTTINGKTGNLKYKGEKPKQNKLRIGKYKPKVPGDLIQIDAIEIFIYNLRRYIVTAIDVKSKFAFAYCYRTLSSNNAKDFFQKFQEVAPFEIKRIQTDNGKEFLKHFRQYVSEQSVIHFYNYPNQPKMNKYIERFNRTIQEQYVSWNMEKLQEPNEFNLGLMDYLIWYNTEKPHLSINKLPPLKYLIDQYILTPEKSNMLWTTTYA